MQNWMYSFAGYLGILLDRILPEKTRISIEKELPKSDDQMVIFLVSPDFLAETDYMKTVQKFSARDTKRMIETNAIAHRIFKVCFMSVPTNQQPDFIQEYTDYQVCEAEIKMEDISFDTGIKSPVWSVLVDLAYDISGSVIEMRDIMTGTPKEQSGPTIFLAETTDDQRENRNALKRELIHFGYNVIPHRHLSGDAAEIEQKINDLLSNASFAIHIVGNKYGEPLAGMDVSLVDLQLKLSSSIEEPAETGEDFQRIIWFPPDLKSADEKQELFVEKLVRQEETLKIAEIVQTPLELLKTIVKKKISGKDKESMEAGSVSLPEKPFVYLIHEEKFKNELEPVLNWFKEKNIDVIWSGMAAEADNIVSLHRHYLSNCSGVLIHYSGNNVPWISSKMKDLLKAPGFGRTEPIKAMAVMVQNGSEFESRISEVDVIPITKGTSEVSFDKFLEKINQ